MIRKKISILVPAFNEEDCIQELCSRLGLLMDSEPNYDFEVFIIENGSSDKTWDILTEISAKDSRIKVIKLSRNFRMDGGLTAGLAYASGDACVLMTADLQDPPELIHDFLRLWEVGYENVYGLVKKRVGTGVIRRMNSQLFYFVANKLTDNLIPRNASDFRLVDRKVYEAVRQMDERNRFVRGLFAWVGFKSVAVEFERPERFGGVSKAHSFKVIDLAFKGIFANSYKPLKLITVFGIGCSALSFLALIPLSIFWAINGVPFSGFGTLLSVLLITFSITSLMIGLLGEYLALIYEEVKSRPNFIVSDTRNIAVTRRE